MSIRRPSTPGEILARCGTLPALAAASLVLFCMPQATLALPQEAQPEVRDPMKPDRTGDNKMRVEVSDQNTVDMAVKNEDIESVLEMLQFQSERNIVLSKNVTGKVSATIKNATFDEALEAILYPNGWNYVVQGNFIYVFTQEEYAQRQKALLKREYKVVRLNYLNAEDAKEFVSMLLSKDGGEIQVNKSSKEFAINDKSPVGKDDYALSATLVIYDYPEHISAIETLLTQLDTKPQQVLVEATILQCSLNEANAFGVDFSIIADMDFTDFINIGGPLSAANNLIRGGTGAANQGFSPADNKGVAIGSTPGNTTGPGTFKAGIVTGDVSIFVRMLDQVTDTVVLSNPKVLALNRQPSRVLVGKRVGYLSTTSTDTSTTQSVEFLDTGTQLYFRPFVSDDGNIRMELKPQVSIADIRTVTDAGGAAVTIPDEVTQELTTNVNVRDGQTIVLGGLFSESSTFTRRQVPWFGDIPIIGAAFRGHDDSTVRSEIIFMITPSIVSDASIASAAAQAEGDIERIRAGTRQGLLPWSRERMTSALNVEAERAARDGDTEKALWLAQRSLALNPHQPAVYQIREKITSEREFWPNPSLLDGMVGAEADRRAARMGEIKPAAEPSKYGTPWNHRKLPKESTGGGGSSMNNTGDFAPGASSNNTTTVASSNDNNNNNNNNNNSSNSNATASADERLQMAPPRTIASTAVEKEAAVAHTQSNLSTLRSQLEIYSVMHDGKVAQLGSGGQNGWQPLFEMNLISEQPDNKYVGGENARKVVVGSAPDTRFHADYGWIFNPQTGQLWAAAFNAEGKPLTPGTTAQANAHSGRSKFDQAGWAAWFGFTSDEMTQFMNQLEGTQTTGVNTDSTGNNK
jgi:type IV pilus assembly protein PilQ